jgi:hypothetical protein
VLGDRTQERMAFRTRPGMDESLAEQQTAERHAEWPNRLPRERERYAFLFMVFRMTSAWVCLRIAFR